jgi:hypothetical protein
MRVRAAAWIGRGLVAGAVLGALATLLARGRGVSGAQLDASWQVLDLKVLADDPLGSLWYLHIQPPVHNLVVGAVMAWSPFPAMGALFVFYALSLLVTGLLLHDILVRWGVQPVVGGVIVALAMVNPSLLSTIHIASYEVPVACLLVTLFWLAQRHLEQPSARWLVLIALTVTVAALTRSLLHPVWVLTVLGVLWLVRSVDRRQIVASLAVPLVLIGGWMLKNEIVFGTPTLTSWLGFNMQRGVTASMDRDEVQAAVADGTVSPIVLEYPWLSLDAYAEWTEPCDPAHDHAATSAELKEPFEGVRNSINYNHECFLPAYQQAQHDAVELIRHDPGRYLAKRVPSLLMSYQTFPVRGGVAGGEPTWMDRVYEPLLAIRTVHVDMSDWNLPLLVPELETLSIKVSLTLVVLSLVILARALVAGVRLTRRGWRERRDWPAEDVVWLLITGTVLLVIVGGDLIEFGENGRFRTMLDPLLVTLPLAWLAQAVQRRWFAADVEPVDDVAGNDPENDEGLASPERDQASVDSDSDAGELASSTSGRRSRRGLADRLV